MRLGRKGWTARDLSCENRPPGIFFFVFLWAEGRVNRVDRYLGLMPSVDARHQGENQRKFSGERLRLS